MFTPVKVHPLYCEDYKQTVNHTRQTSVSKQMTPPRKWKKMMYVIENRDGDGEIWYCSPLFTFIIDYMGGEAKRTRERTREREEKSEARPLTRRGRVQTCQGHGWVVRPRGTRLPRRAASPGLPPLDHSGIPRGLFTQAINTGGSSFYSQHCQSYLAALLLYFSNHFSSCN